MPTSLVIVDGHTLTRFGLRALISQQSDIEVAAESGLMAEAVRVIRYARPDVVTIDVTLPDGDGLRLARDLREDWPDLGIVMLASRGEDELLFRALDAGASAFVEKTAPVGEVMAAIRHAAVAATSFTATGLAGALARRRSASDRMALSRRESEVLDLLKDGLSVPAIATSMFVSQSTAKTYVSRLYEKLGASNRAQALMTAMHHGLIHYEERPGDAAESRVSPHLARSPAPRIAAAPWPAPFRPAAHAG